jgi:hypothetical protein
MPEEWYIAVVVPMYKKGSKDDCNNYWGISKLNSCYKIYSVILNNQINKIAGIIILDNQHGFQKGCLFINFIFVMTQLIERRRCIIFWPFFLLIWKILWHGECKKLWNVIMERVFLQCMVRVVWSLYHETQIRVERESEKYGKQIFKSHKVLRQRCPLLPTSFILYIDEDRWRHHVRWVPCHHAMAPAQVADGGDSLQFWKVAANMLNKQLRAADKGWSSSLGVGRGANNSSP